METVKNVTHETLSFQFQMKFMKMKMTSSKEGKCCKIKFDKGKLEDLPQS